MLRHVRILERRNAPFMVGVQVLVFHRVIRQMDFHRERKPC
jgi:hypothetical protein